MLIYWNDFGTGWRAETQTFRGTLVKDWNVEAVSRILMVFERSIGEGLKENKKKCYWKLGERGAY
jgi:hypothetical protein